MTDLSAVKQRQQQTWASGDYGTVAARLQIVSELLCEAADLRGGEKVLDVATGTGNTALAAARRFCEVTATDYVPALLERGRARAAAEGLEVEFREGDVEDIRFPDHAFDAVLSTFGSMFAPDHEKAAAEMVRVCRPGGRIGMANWSPEGFVGAFFKAVSQRVPPPPGVRPPLLWGSEESLRQILGKDVTLTATRREFIFRYRSPEHWLEVFRTTFGPVLKAFEALDEAGREDLARALLEVMARYNRATDGTLVAPAEYLEVVAVRR